MEVLRVPPYPITTKWDVPEADAQYLIYVEDLVDHSVETEVVTSDENSQVTYILPRSKVQFDRDFVFKIHDTDIFGDIVVDSNLTVYRPYVDPNTLGTTPSEIAEYKRLEIIARSIIDSYVGNDSATGEAFYNHKQVIQQVGQGTDYFPIWHNVKKILKVYENNVLVYNGEDVALTVADAVSSAPGGLTVFTTNVAHNFAAGDTITITGFAPSLYNGTYKVNSVISSTEFDISLDTYSTPATDTGTVQRVWDHKYVISTDNSAIMRVGTETVYDRYESAPLRLPVATGDLSYYGRPGVAFPRGTDYIFILDVGYKAVPPDVEQAAIMLINDLKCGNNEYYKRFVTQYSTDQFDMKFAPQFLQGTGNMIVDKILENYKGNVFKPGVI
jgi:hypothetical protein